MSCFLFFEPTSNFPAFPHVPSLHDQGPLDMLYSSLLFKLECLSPRELEKNTILLKLRPLCFCSAGDSDIKSEN